MAIRGGKSTTLGRVTGTNREIFPIQVGPWPEGLNNREGDYGFRDIKPGELLVCSNLDVLESGILVNRPGFSRYDANIFSDTVGINVSTLGLRNVIGSVRLDNQYNEGLVQFYDSANLNLYLVKTSVVGGGEFTDFAMGYWVKQAIIAGQNYWITSVVRYNKNVYLTTNNAFLNEASTFTGGFYYGYSPIPTVKTVFAIAPIYQSGPDVGQPAPLEDMCIDNANNIYTLVSATSGLTLDGFITKITPGGVSSIFASGLDLVKNMCTDGTNIYITGFGNGSSIYGNTINKIDPTGAITTIVPAGSIYYYEGFVFDASIGSLVCSQNYQIGSELWSNLVSINVTTFTITTIWTDVIGGLGEDSANILTKSTTIPGLYYGVGAFLGAETFRIDSYSAEGIGVVVVSPQVLGTTAVTIITSVLDTQNDVVFVADGVATNGTVVKVNISTQTVTQYVTGLDGPTEIVEDSTGNLFIYEKNQSRIIKAAVPATPALNPITLMPFGDLSFMFKDRMWIINKATNRCYYSKPTDPTGWNVGVDGSGFFDVNPGDGLSITDCIVSSNQMFIFKETGTWRFTFSSDPGVDGTLAVLSKDRGAFSATVYNNVPYIVGKQGVQKLINGFFIDVSQQIRDYNPFFTTDSIIDNFKNRLYVTLQSHATGQPHMLTMNLISGAWSTYDLSDVFGSTQFPVESHMFGCGINCALFLAQNGSELAVGALNNISSDNIVTNLGGLIAGNPPIPGGIGSSIQIFTANNIQTTRQIPPYTVQTMYYDFDTPLNWKKLDKTSVDVLSTFFNFESITTPYSVNLNLDFKTPLVDNKGILALNTTAHTTALGPDGFPVLLAIYDVLTQQYFSPHRFQVITFGFSTALTPLTSPGNAAQLVIKKASAYITQKASKGDDARL